MAHQEARLEQPNIDFFVGGEIPCALLADFISLIDIALIVVQVLGLDQQHIPTEIIVFTIHNFLDMLNAIRNVYFSKLKLLLTRYVKLTDLLFDVVEDLWSISASLLQLHGFLKQIPAFLTD